LKSTLTRELHSSPWHWW